jgi:simple sugar transport system permease protein
MSRGGPGRWAFLALCLLLFYNVLFTPNFGRLEIKEGRLFGAAVDILQNGAPVMLLSLGMCLVIALGGIDLSVGSVMALAGTVAAIGFSARGWPVPAAVGAALGVCLAAGLWNGLLVWAVGLQPIVATLVLLVAGRGLAQTLTHDQKIRFEEPSFEFIGNGSWMGLPVPCWLLGAMAVALWWLLRRTALGLYVEAIGDNPRAARLCGLPIGRIQLGVYAFCSLCAGLAGLVATADIKEADVARCGLYLELDAILAVVLGGTPLTGGRPSLGGTLAGAMLMQTLTVMLQMRGVVTEHTLLVKAVVVVVVCLLQSAPFLRGRGR